MATRAAETAAKETVFQRIVKEFGTDSVGIYDKKLYVNVVQNGEPVQIAISLTCPKIPVGSVGNGLAYFEDLIIPEWLHKVCAVSIPRKSARLLKTNESLGFNFSFRAGQQFPSW